MASAKPVSMLVSNLAVLWARFSVGAQPRKMFSYARHLSFLNKLISNNLMSHISKFKFLNAATYCSIGSPGLCLCWHNVMDFHGHCGHTHISKYSEYICIICK